MAKRRAKVWEHFELRRVVGGHPIAVCKYCRSTKYKAEGRTGTSNLTRHLDVCKAFKDTYHSNVSEFDQQKYCQLFARAILLHGYSLSIVEHEGLRELHAYLNSNVKTISRNTILKWCVMEHTRLRGYVQDALNSLTSKVCLTCDIWTACTSRAYLTLTVHYIDDSWKLHSKVLNFVHFPPPHNGDAIFNLLMELIKSWGIERKVFSMTIDNASNMDSMVSRLRSQLNSMKALPCDGKYFHSRCSTHLLNLIVKEGLSRIDVCVSKHVKISNMLQLVRA